MKQTGIIIEKNDSMAKVKMQRHSACGNCGGCGLTKKNKEISIDAINKINGDIGDFVEVDIDNPNVLKAAIIAYVIPLITLLVGIVFGSKILVFMKYKGNAEIASAFIGLTLTAIVYVVINMNESKFKKSGEYTPIITSILAK